MFLHLWIFISFLDFFNGLSIYVRCTSCDSNSLSPTILRVTRFLYNFKIKDIFNSFLIFCIVRRCSFVLLFINSTGFFPGQDNFPFFNDPHSRFTFILKEESIKFIGFSCSSLIVNSTPSSVFQGIFPYCCRYHRI